MFTVNSVLECKVISVCWPGLVVVVVLQAVSPTQSPPVPHYVIRPVCSAGVLLQLYTHPFTHKTQTQTQTQQAHFRQIHYVPLFTLNSKLLKSNQPPFCLYTDWSLQDARSVWKGQDFELLGSTEEDSPGNDLFVYSFEMSLAIVFKWEGRILKMFWQARIFFFFSARITYID